MPVDQLGALGGAASRVVVQLLFLFVLHDGDACCLFLGACDQDVVLTAGVADRQGDELLSGSGFPLPDVVFCHGVEHHGLKHER